MSAGRLTHPPGTVFGAAAVICAVATAVLAGSSSPPALAVGAVGVIAVTFALVRNRRRHSALGGFALLGAVVITGAGGAPPAVVLPATATALLAWSFGSEAIDAHEELSGGAVARSEVLRTVVAIGVGAVATAAAYGVFRTLAVGVSVTGVVLLLVAAAALGMALRE